MVLSRVVTSIINQYLSPFVDDLSSDQLNLFSLSGDISLTDVALKANAFEELKLPLRIVHGNIGRIEISIPWLSLYSAPIQVKVSDVYAVVQPNWEVTLSEKEEKEAQWTRKKATLDSLEQLKQKLKESK